MTSPVHGGILGRRHNKTLHGRSVHRVEDVPGHNVVLGYSRPGVGDALDIFLPAGEPVYAMHDGRIDRIADRGGRLSCVYVTAASTGSACVGGGSGRVVTIYAHLHIHERLRLGTRVHEGELIGWVGRQLADPHLHLEVWVAGKSVSAGTADELAAKIETIANSKSAGFGRQAVRSNGRSDQYQSDDERKEVLKSGKT